MSPETSVRKSVVVNAPIAHAFKVFTERFDSWWPRTHHIGKVEPYTAIMEPREGGRWFERGRSASSRISRTPSMNCPFGSSRDQSSRSTPGTTGQVGNAQNFSGIPKP
jgi:hypothetical protein